MTDIPETAVEAACRAHTPQWALLDTDIKQYARGMMRAALAAASPFMGAVRDWQPMDTAPKDATEILAARVVKDEPYFMQVAYWDPEKGAEWGWWIVDAHCARHQDFFTHWMPLPEPGSMPSPFNTRPAPAAEPAPPARHDALREALEALKPFAELIDAADRAAVAAAREQQPQAAAGMTDEEIADVVDPARGNRLTDGVVAFGRRHSEGHVTKVVTTGDLRRARSVHRRLAALAAVPATEAREGE